MRPPQDEWQYKGNLSARDIRTVRDELPRPIFKNEIGAEAHKQTLSRKSAFMSCGKIVHT